MAKKSNKTEHVLKLITKNEDAAQDDVFFAIEEITENGTSAMKSELKAELADIPDEIELGLDQLMGIEPSGNEIPQVVSEEEIQPQAAEISLDKPWNLDELEDFMNVDEDLEAFGTPMDIPEVTKEPDMPEPPTLKAFREQESPVVVIQSNGEEMVNIAEVLAREKLFLVMERMKVCSCKTCANDVLALALNSLPTKYVTTDAGKQYFQRDEYKKQYETEILAALTKACVRVKASPRHQQR